MSPLHLQVLNERLIPPIEALDDLSPIPMSTADHRLIHLPPYCGGGSCLLILEHSSRI